MFDAFFSGDPGTSTMVLIAAVALDAIVGDPIWIPHPVQLMGGVIGTTTQSILGRYSTPRGQKIAGVALAIAIVTSSAFLVRSIVAIAYQLHWFLGMATASVLLASCFANRSLSAAAYHVLQPSIAGDLETARSRLSGYVGRDTQHLSGTEIGRALLETIAENTTDGITAPLFYAIVGAFFPAIGSAPLAIAYKAASTLDSMVGYREKPYTYIGWASAKLDDILTWLPCRLTVVTIALLGGKPFAVWRTCRCQATRDPSPNSGWSECAFAVALEVQLGGLNYYRGVPKYKPILGHSQRLIGPEVIHRALFLSRASFIFWLGMGAIALVMSPSW